MSTDLKTIFRVALEQAALGDLQFTLRIAEQRLQYFEVPDRTLDLMRQMKARELSLIGVKGTKAMQTESLRLVQAYRASIPGYGSARKHVAFMPGRTKHGRIKYVGHRTLLRQRLTPLTPEQVTCMVTPVEALGQALSVPAKPQTRRKPAPAVSVPAPLPTLQTAVPVEIWGCPVCAMTKKKKMSQTEGTFGCKCGAQIQLVVVRGAAAQAA